MSAYGRPNEVVMITGASSGVGRATARAFARRGARIGLLARGEDGLRAAEAEVRQAGGEALVLAADVSDAEQVARAAAELERRFGPIDVWINNAAVSVYAPITQISVEDFRRVTEVDYLGTVYGTMAALRTMTPRNRGVIIQVGSSTSYRGLPLLSAYSGAKHAVQGFTEAVRSELRHEKRNVRLTIVHLPSVNTPLFSNAKNQTPRRPGPTSPVFQPEVAADAIVWAAEHDCREVTLGLPIALLFAANRVLPGAVDWLFGRWGYEMQLTAEPSRPGGPHNLWQPLPGDRGARGSFEAGAMDKSLQFELIKRRPAAGLLSLGVALLAATWLRKRGG
jgi:short-subunit dehydrogenase